MTSKRIRTRSRDIDSALIREALSELLGAEASRSAQVAAFRKEILQGELLKPGEVPDWIAAQHERDKTPAALKRSLPPGTAEEIQFEYPGSAHVGVWPVFPGGVLDYLREIGNQLVRTYGWERALATTFVLTGVVPSVPAIKVCMTPHFKYTRLNRITLEVDPSVGPREVMQRYREARANFIETRMRRLGAKSVLIVLFHLEQKAKNPAITWREEMNLWNKKHRRRPDFRIAQESNYGKRHAEAVRNLLMVSRKGTER
jgi:hypothetical protein